MWRRRFKALTVVLMTMAAALPELASPAAAIPPARIGVIAVSGLNVEHPSLVTEVGYRYDGRHYGNRYNYRRHGYNNHYYGNRYYRYGGGRYYNYGWPYYGGIGLGYGLGYPDYNGYYGGGYPDDVYDGGAYYGGGEYGGDGHMEWCLNRYRSYNPRTDTYLGYDGYRHRCNSPY